jgi:predicted metal-dependent hydrolase
MAIVQGSTGDAQQSENIDGGDNNDNSHANAVPSLRLVLPWQSGARDRPILIEDLTDAHKVQLADLVARWMSSWALDVLTMRVAYFAPLLGVSWTKIKLSRSASRWGSANARGELAFNRHLAHVSMPLLDYVVVHELSHFKHMNHSPAFWRVVEGVMPDYDKRRAMLQKTPMPDWQAWDALRTA